MEFFKDLTVSQGVHVILAFEALRFIAAIFMQNHLKIQETAKLAVVLDKWLEYTKSKDKTEQEGAGKEK